MLVRDIFHGCLDGGKTPFSFEFFPPKTHKGWDHLFASMQKLLPLAPAYVSVTYGAGGSTRNDTYDLVSNIHGKGLPVVAHLTCEGNSEREIAAILERYDREGVHNILALKGDVPVDRRSEPAFPRAADLVAYIKKRFPHFGVAVACFPEGHPATPNRLKEMDFLKKKVDAGADYMVTQLFFDNADFYDFRERCQLSGVDLPVIAGLMPVTSIKGMERMAELASRSKFPSNLLQRLQRVVNNLGGNWGHYGAPENNTREITAAVKKIGEHWTTEQISDLLNHGVAGVHLYTLNHSRSAINILENLGFASYSIKSSQISPARIVEIQ